MTAAPLEVAPASAADVATLRNLFQLYIHDFSEFWAGEARGELGPDGRFPDYLRAEPFLERANWRAFLLRLAGAPVGFALINDETHSGLPADHSMAEFFVVRKHRGSGLAEAAATRLFRSAPGKWEAAVARKNLRALAFWRRVVRGCARPGSITELDCDGDDWNGPILRFEIRA